MDEVGMDEMTDVMLDDCDAADLDVLEEEGI
jgi:hypothetical protein